MKINFELKGLKEIYNLTKEEISIIADNNLSAISMKEGVIVKVELIGEILEKGSLLLKPEILKNIKVKNADVVINENTLKVKNRKFTFTEEEAKIKENNIGEKIATLTTKDYEKIISVEYAVAKEDIARPIIKNVCVNNDDIVALDGHRLAIRKNDIEFEADNNNFLIPYTVIKLMKKIKPNNIIEVYKNKHFITMKIDNISLTAKVEQENYFNYKELLPQEYKIETKINSKELEILLEILKGYDKDSKLLEMDISKEKMILKINNGKFIIEDEIKVNSNGEIFLGVNPNYLRDALLNNYDDEISIRFNSNTQPFYIEKNGYYDLVMPIRIKNAD